MESIISIGATIKELRNNAGISQQDFAVTIGISGTSLSQIERGLKRPREKTLLKIADSLGISVIGLYVLSISINDVREEKRILFNVLHPIFCKIFEPVKNK